MLHYLRGRPVPAGLLAWAMMSSAALLAAAQDEFNQHDVHQHGVVTVNIALDEQSLRVELQSPADSVIGFEHAPRSEEQHAAVKQAADWLGSGRGMVLVPAAARCRLDKAHVDAPQWPARDSRHADHDLDPGERHHQDYRVVLDYRCEQPAALHWLQLAVMERLRDVHEMRVQVITPTRQASQTLTDAATRVQLR